MPIQPLTFTGASSLSESLQTVLSRAVSIASIPLKQMQAASADTLQRKVLLTGLSGAAEKLASAVAKLGTVASGGSLSASSSNSAKVVVQNNGITKAVSYTISDIESLATAASASTDSFASTTNTAVSRTGQVELTIDDKSFSLTLAKNNLVGLRDAINSSGAGVTATILSAGTDKHYLSLSANSVGAVKSLKLLDAPSEIPTPVFATNTLGSDGSAASARTLTVASASIDPISTTGSMALVIGGQAHPLTLGENTLDGLRDAINALGAGVTASVVADGDGAYLSVTANAAGELTAFHLIDDPEGAALPSFTDVNLGSNPSRAQGTTAVFADPATTPVSATGAMQLVIAGDTHAFTLQDNSLNGLRDAINALNSGVTATVITDESGSRLSVVADDAGELTAFSLLDEPTDQPADLLKDATLGSNSKFKLNGIAVEQKTNVISSVVPGMTFRLLGVTDPSEQVVLNFSTDRAQLSTAISEFVTAYNAMQEVVGQQVGSNAGLLTGATVVRDIQANMRALASYGADGAVKSLAEMGLTFDQSGKLAFDATALATLTDTAFEGALSFFGSPTSGFGGLAKKFSQLTNPITGLIKLEQDGCDRTDRNLQSQMATLEERINAMQIATAQRLQAADAILARLESQQTMLEASIKSVSLVLYGKNDK